MQDELFFTLTYFSTSPHVLQWSFFFQSDFISLIYIFKTTLNELCALYIPGLFSHIVRCGRDGRVRDYLPENYLKGM